MSFAESLSLKPHFLLLIAIELDFNSFGVCNGFAEKKHNKLNVKYTSYHKYYTFNNMVYYENIYFFDDDTISYALYKKI